MTVLLADGTTRTVNGDEFSIDEQGNMVVTSSGQSVAGFAVGRWAAVYLTNQVSTP
jgi:hypothetical protein